MGQPPSAICTLGVVFMSSKTIGETTRFLGFYAIVKFFCSLDMTFCRILVFHSNCFMFLNGNLNSNYHVNLTIIQSKLVCISHYVNRPFPSCPKAWFPYRCICRTKKIHRTDTTLWKPPVQMLNAKETTDTTC